MGGWLFFLKQNQKLLQKEDGSLQKKNKQDDVLLSSSKAGKLFRGLSCREPRGVFEAQREKQEKKRRKESVERRKLKNAGERRKEL